MSMSEPMRYGLWTDGVVASETRQYEVLASGSQDRRDLFIERLDRACLFPIEVRGRLFVVTSAPALVDYIALGVNGVARTGQGIALDADPTPLCVSVRLARDMFAWAA